jgi:hypothetical protein
MNFIIMVSNNILNLIIIIMMILKIIMFTEEIVLYVIGIICDGIIIITYQNKRTVKKIIQMN